MIAELKSTNISQTSHTHTCTGPCFFMFLNYYHQNITCSVDHHQLNIQQFYPEHLVLWGEWVLLKVDLEDEGLANK